MPGWSRCKLELHDPGGDIVFEDDDCDVRIDPGRIRVSWFHEDGPVVFVGGNDGGGRFELVCRSRPRRGRLELRRAPDVLEGTWSEDGLEGGWRIELGEPGE